MPSLRSRMLASCAALLATAAALGGAELVLRDGRVLPGESVRREGGNVIVESVCEMQGTTAASRGVFSGDFKTAYKGEMVTKFSPPMHGMAESKMSFQARHKGPCQAAKK